MITEILNSISEDSTAQLIFIIITIFFIINWLNVVVRGMYAYINDSDYKPPKYLVKTKIFKSNYEKDSVEYFMSCIFVTGISSIIAILVISLIIDAWFPIIIIVCIIVALPCVRYFCRGAKIIKKYIHDHPDTVEKIIVFEEKEEK